MSGEVITQTILDSINNESAARENKGRLEELGGVSEIALGLGVVLDVGVASADIQGLREKYGDNTFPESPMTPFFEILLEALSDTTLLILVAAATTSLVIGVITEPEDGWIEGTAIFIAVGAVSMISAGNDYTKQLQFRALEDASAKDEKCGVLRDDRKDVIPVNELVVGDVLILQAGDQIPADCVIFDTQSLCKSNEASLTGEPDDLAKSRDVDPFLLSSCHVIDVAGQECRAMIIAVGKNSQWGKIKGKLASESVNTPLQEKLEAMTQQIGLIGMGAALGTFLALTIRIWAEHGGNPTQREIVDGFVHAFIMAVTIVVVAIPEGLPLAVTISLAYSTKKMYTDNCFIRVLAACETMGNATNICSDKTGTLTENKMAVVEGWFADKYYNREDFTIQENEVVERQNSEDSKGKASLLRQSFSLQGVGKGVGMISGALSGGLLGGAAKKAEVEESKTGGGKDPMVAYKIIYRAPDVAQCIRHLFAEHVSVNRTAYLIYDDSLGQKLDTPGVIGSKTEGALLLMSKAWGLEGDHVKAGTFNDATDKLFSFNSTKKRSTCIVHRPDGSIRLFCKGASETLLKDAAFFTGEDGTVHPMTKAKFTELNEIVGTMADKALRTLVLAHVDFPKESSLPANWTEDPPDSSGLCVDAMVGIMDPLRSDVKEAVSTAQAAGVTVRMVTGDNIKTAIAIAKDCGILRSGGLSIEGPVFRKMTPKDLDSIISRLQVMARSSPDDKHLMVTRLNGHAIPANKAEWIEKFKDKMKHYDISWETHKDKLLPGYKEEWMVERPEGGQVVGVTGDGTNDAPALKAADVGLAMGITGTKVAQGAADIVILDDRFSSIVRAMMWGRSVYDNIRKFLQFQLTVNVVACCLVFIGATLGKEPPLNAVQMLWVNLVMDTLGALALGTEPPIPELLQRKPYKRSSSLISWPMRRNIFVQAVYQLGLLMFLMVSPHTFNLREGVGCYVYVHNANQNMWDLGTGLQTNNILEGDINCKSFTQYCDPPELGLYKAGSADANCLLLPYTQDDVSNGVVVTSNVNFQFDKLDGFYDSCLECHIKDYTHGSFLFNTFIWCQIFNEFSSRVLFNELNIFRNLSANYMFAIVMFFTIGAQIVLIEKGGDFMKTSSLSFDNWIITIILGSFTLPLGFLMRLYKMEEDPFSYFDNGGTVAQQLGDSSVSPSIIKSSHPKGDLDRIANLNVNNAKQSTLVAQSPVKVSPTTVSL